MPPIAPPSPLPGIESLTAVAYALHLGSTESPDHTPAEVEATLLHHADVILDMYRWRGVAAETWAASAPWYVRVFDPVAVAYARDAINKARARRKRLIVGRRVGFGANPISTFQPYANARGTIIAQRRSKYLAPHYHIRLDDGREVWAQRCNLNWNPKE